MSVLVEAVLHPEGRIGGTVHALRGPRVPRVRDVKRGPQAWDNVDDEADNSLRLLAHAVSDKTASECYIKEAWRFLGFVESIQPPFSDWVAVDWALTRFLAHECYVLDRTVASGEHLMNGFAYMWPGQPFPRAFQALKAWKRITVHNEGVALPLEDLVCMEEILRTHKEPNARIAGAMIPVAVDGYCREGDRIPLRVEDVTDTGAEVILHFGRKMRGESAKTGREQGVRLDFPHSHDIIRTLIKGKKPHAKVFGISATTYRNWWWTAAKKVGADAPPHATRHTGASRDLAEGYRTFQQVQRRGRWLAERSVQRYTKTHLWLKAKEDTRADVRTRGQEILAARAPRPGQPKD